VPTTSGPAIKGQCRVLDVSAEGAGLELYGTFPRHAVGATLTVHLEGSGAGRSAMDLDGTIRNWSMTKFGFVRVGVEFLTLDAEAREFLASLTEPARL
jgi:hypothetical protein